MRHSPVWSRIPLPAVAALALLLLGGAVQLATARGVDVPRPDATLRGIADAAGCRLQEFDAERATNPPVTGERVERTIARDGSYVGRRPPSVGATVHALLHGSVLIQYRPGIRERELRALDRLVESDPDHVVAFANQTGMTAPVAATAYLSLLTCPRVDAGTLRALRAFRDRRRQFGTAF
jgi:DnaJ-domain-containing protein 1